MPYSYVINQVNDESGKYFVARERENGSPEKAASVTQLSNEKGYITISMKNDWKTIYGENINKILN